MSVYTDLCIADGAVFLYPLQETSGTNADELVGDLDGTYAGTPTLASSGPGVHTGVTFDGTDDQVSRAHDAVFDWGTGDYSIEFWIYISATDATIRYLVCHDGNGGAGAWDTRIQNGALSGRVNATTSNNSAVLSTGAWHHCVASVDRGGNFTWYVDGSTSGTPKDISAEVAALTASVTFYIGRRASSGFFNQRLALVAGYPFAMSSTMAAAHYAAVSATVVDPFGMSGFFGV